MTMMRIRPTRTSPVAFTFARPLALKTVSPAPARRPRALALECLEGREVPAVTVLLDYSHDTAGFFDDPARRAILQTVVDDLASHLTAPLAAVAPAGGNTWSETFFDPATGLQTSVPNPTLAANTIVIYAGGRDLTGAEAGVGGFGGYSAGGTQSWLNSIAARGPGFALWGGSLALDTSGTNWYFGTSAAGMRANQVDFTSVVTHEVGHILGLGTAPTWFGQVSGGAFRGPAARAVYGGPVPVTADGAHWANGLTVGRSPVSLDPVMSTGTRVAFSALDYAALGDAGWSVSGVAGVAPTAAPPPPPAPVPPTVTPVPLNSPLYTPGGTGGFGGGAARGADRLVALTGPTDGSVQLFGAGADGILAAAGPKVYPFPNYAGSIRTAVGDFDGDGSTDIAAATGPGAAATVRIISGKTGADLVGPTPVLGGFTGGAFLAAGDVNRDGKDELAVSNDAGSTPVVSLFKVQAGALGQLLQFVPFDTPTFLGGARVTLADVDRDGFADLIVGAGVGGGPRVSVYDGQGLPAARLTRLIPDFFALDPALRSGVYVTAGDFDADGYADIAYSTGDTGGPRVRVVGGSVLVSHPGADLALLPAVADFFVWDSTDRKGIRIAARDLDGDGRAELVVGSGNRTAATVRVVPAGQMNVPTTSLQNPFGDPTTTDGIYVG